MKIIGLEWSLENYKRGDEEIAYDKSLKVVFPIRANTVDDERSEDRPYGIQYDPEIIVISRWMKDLGLAITQQTVTAFIMLIRGI